MQIADGWIFVSADLIYFLYSQFPSQIPDPAHHIEWKICQQDPNYCKTHVLSAGQEKGIHGS